MAITNQSPSQVPTISRNPRGKEFAAYLNNSISMDSADMFSRLDGTFRSRMSYYFKFKELDCPERMFESLLVPIRAGGAVVQRDLPRRLEEIFPDKHEKEILEIAIDLDLLLDEVVKDFNYIRYLQNAVSGILRIVLNPDTAQLIPELSVSARKVLETKQSEIWAHTINTVNSLEIWNEKVIDFNEQVNDLHGANDFVDTENGEIYVAPSNKVLSARKSKNYVNTKTLSTYSSRTRMYSLYKSRSLFPGMIYGDEPVEKIFMKYKSTSAPSTFDLSVLRDIKKREKAQKEFSLTGKKQVALAEKNNLMTIEFPFSGDRKIRIRHSQDGVVRELIKPIVNNLRAQIKLDPNKEKRLVNVENSNGFLSVEIDNIKSSDIAKIESILEELSV